MRSGLTMRPMNGPVWPQARPKGAAINAVRLLPELRRAGRAQARLLPPQACGDGADVGDFAGTETIDVGGAGAALLGRPLVLRECRSGCKQREE
jgi:hypothetical protein